MRSPSFCLFFWRKICRFFLGGRCEAHHPAKKLTPNNITHRIWRVSSAVNGGTDNNKTLFDLFVGDHIAKKNAVSPGKGLSKLCFLKSHLLPLSKTSWWLNHPSDNYAQIGSFSPRFQVNPEKSLKPLDLVYLYLTIWYIFFYHHPLCKTLICHIFFGGKKFSSTSQDAVVSTCQRQGGPTKRHTASTDFLATTAFSQAVTLEIQPIDFLQKQWKRLG